MSTLDDAMYVSWVVVMVIGVPFMVLAVPAGLLVMFGNWANWNQLLDSGFHWIGFFGAILCLLILVVGVILD